MIKRYIFKFHAYVTKDVEFPDDCEEGSAAWEAALDAAEQDIDVNRYAECIECVEARKGRKVSEP